MPKRRVELQVDHSGVRLDRFLAVQHPRLSRTRWKSLIKQGLVLVDGVVEEQPATLLTGGQTVQAQVPGPSPTTLQPESIPLDILYEDDQLIAVNKPAGMVVHPSAGHPTGTLVQAVLAHAPAIEGVGGERRPGVVHRLDKGTSGVILFAKDDPTHRWLQAQFKQRQVAKAYLALVDGQPPTPQGLIDAPIARHATHRKKMTVVPKGRGRVARTEFRTLETFESHTLLRVEPTTGRTHQIRVHLDYIGSPVAGDRTYGRSRVSIPLGRPFLHAYEVSVPQPADGGRWEFRAQLPVDLISVLVLLGSSWLVHNQGES